MLGNTNPLASRCRGHFLASLSAFTWLINRCQKWLYSWHWCAVISDGFTGLIFTVTLIGLVARLTVIVYSYLDYGYCTFCLDSGSASIVNLPFVRMRTLSPCFNPLQDNHPGGRQTTILCPTFINFRVSIVAIIQDSVEIRLTPVYT